MKMKFLVAALALIGAGVAQAASLPTSATGGSLVFEAWDGSKSYSQVLNYDFNTVYSAAGNAGVANNYSVSLDSGFSSLSSSGLLWHVVAGKSANDTTSRIGVMSTWNSTATPTINNTALGSAVGGLTTYYNNLNTLLAGGTSAVAATNTDPAYAGRTQWAGSFGVAAFGNAGGNAVSGFYTGSIDATTVYAPGTGVGAFYSFVNNGGPSSQQSNKALYGNAQGNGAWILQSNGTLTYHTAEAAAAAVPLPAAVWLFGSGLMGLVGIGRRRNKQA